MIDSRKNIICTIKTRCEESSSKSFTLVSLLQSAYPVRLVEIKRRGNDRTAHIIIMGFGGGMLSCDKTSFHVTVGARSSLCLSTPGSTKVFKSDDEFSAQMFDFIIEEHGILVFVPDITCMYQSSKLCQSQKFSLTDTSSIILVDWYSCGRRGRDDFWSLHALMSAVEICVGDACVFGEDLHLMSTESGSVAMKVGGYSVFGIAIILGPHTESLRHRADAITQRQTYANHRQSLLSSKLTNQGTRVPVTHSALRPLISVSTFLESRMTVIRLATAEVETAYQLMAALLQPAEAVIGYKPYADRFAAGAEMAGGSQHIFDILNRYDNEHS